MKIKTSDLIGPALDWAVAAIEEVLFPRSIPKYSTDWAQGGPIIEREEISVLSPYAEHPAGMTGWLAHSRYKNAEHPQGPAKGHGATPLVAAIRCYVASILGEEVEVPDELS